eukprot:828480-Prymnesium_polylepis.1
MAGSRDSFMPAAILTPCSFVCQPCTCPAYPAAVLGSTPFSSTNAATKRMKSHSSASFVDNGALGSSGRWGV